MGRLAVRRVGKTGNVGSDLKRKRGWNLILYVAILFGKLKLKNRKEDETVFFTWKKGTPLDMGETSDFDMNVNKPVIAEYNKLHYWRVQFRKH